MDLTSTPEAGPSTKPHSSSIPEHNAVNEVGRTRRSRSPAPSPRIPPQPLPTPGLTGGPARKTNAEENLDRNPHFLEPQVAGNDCETKAKAAKSPPMCTLCVSERRQEAKYTCPRCGTKTCSVACSKKHKEASGCSGERNRAAYVPMKEYGWSIMMNDYTFLEDIGRKVSEVGREIVRGGYSYPSADNSIRGGNQGRGRGVGIKRGKGGPGGKTRRDVWKMQMEVRDVDVDLLPLGMKRRKANQSSWDFKNQVALLTLELKFYPPSHSFTNGRTSPTSSPKPNPSQPLTILIHRSNSSQSLSNIIHSLVLDRCKKEALKGKPTESEASSNCPEWLKAMVSTPSYTDTNPLAKIKMVMRAPVDPVLILNELKREVEESRGEREYKSGLGKLLSSRLAAYARPSASPASPAPLKRKRTPYPPGFKFPKVYYSLDNERTLLNALRHTTFVEYPTIEVYEEGDERLGGCLFVQPGKLDVPGEVTRNGPGVDTISLLEGGAQPQRKRRKLDPKEAKERIKGLVGDYGSDSGEEGAEEPDASKKGFTSLVGEYAGSDDDEGQMLAPLSGAGLEGSAGFVGPDDDGLHDEDAEGEDDPDLDDGGEELDAAALLELVRQVKGEQWAKEQERMDEDSLDWEGSDADLDAEGDVDDEENL